MNNNKATKKQKTVKDALIDFYITVKPRKEQDQSLNTEDLNEEKEHLQQLDPITLVEYIQSSIDVIVQILVEERLAEYNKEHDDPQEYENLLQKLEGDIRGHIRTELQLKIHSENLQCEIDEFEKKVEALQLQLQAQAQAQAQAQSQFQNKNTNRKQGISCATKGVGLGLGYNNSNSNNNNYVNNNNNTSCSNTYTNPNAQNNDENNNNQNKTEVNNYKQLLKSYENQTLKLAENERRLKSQLLKKDKELKLIELNYKDQIRILNKKVYYFEEKLKATYTNNNTIKPSTFRDEFHYQNNNNNNSTSTRKTNSVAKPQHQQQSSLPSQKTENYIRKTVGVDYNKAEVKEQSFRKTKSHGGVNKSHSSSFVMKKSSNGNCNGNDINNNHNKEDLLTKIDNCSKKILKESPSLSDKQKKKGHCRHKSMQNNAIHMKTQKVNLIKDMLFNSNITTHHRKTNSQTKLSERLVKKNTSTSVAPSNNFVINQTGAPFVNNINIYTTHTHDSQSNNNKNNNNNNNENNYNNNGSSSHHQHNQSSSSSIYKKLNPEILRKTISRKNCSVCQVK